MNGAMTRLAKRPRAAAAVPATVAFPTYEAEALWAADQGGQMKIGINSQNHSRERR
jgi:hypothetical protein